MREGDGGIGGKACGRYRTGGSSNPFQDDILLGCAVAELPDSYLAWGRAYGIK
jgi:hypothetical protein